VFKNRLETVVIQPNSKASFNCESNLVTPFELKWFWNERISINETDVKFSVHNQTLTVYWVGNEFKGVEYSKFQTDKLKNGIIGCKLYTNNQLLSQQSAEITIETETKKARSPLEKSATHQMPKKRESKQFLFLVLIGLFVGVLISCTSFGFFCLILYFYRKGKNDELASNGSKQPLNKDTL
jgi:hypothetical protein